jgi:hypothetical protein
MLYLKKASKQVSSQTSKQNRLSKEKYIMSVRFIENADKILIVYDRNTVDGIF